MTREAAREIVSLRGAGCHRTAFEDYARDAEAFDGPAFWRSFATLDEFWDDFDRYLRYEGQSLVAA